MPFVTTNGLTTHVQEMGTGAPVVLIHGLFVGNLAGWYFAVAPALAERHRVMLYDLRGHGRSDRPTSGYGLTDLTDDLEALVERVELPLDLVGHSYGALVCLRFALRHPTRVRRLVLLEAPLPPHDNAATGAIHAFDGREQLGAVDPAEVRSNVLDHASSAELLQALPAQASRAILRGGRGLTRLTRNLTSLLTETTILRDIEAEPDLDDAVLATLDMPTLCIYGRQSACRPVADRLVGIMPNARLTELEGGHWLLDERPREIRDAIVQFLDV